MRIEIIRPFSGQNISAVLFDFDGTISREREGWPDIMVATNAAALAQAIPSLSPKEAEEWVIQDIQTTIGIPTYSQMKRLAEHITKLGGNALPAQRYKDVYNSLLVKMVHAKHARAREIGDVSHLRVAGIAQFLPLLAKKFPNSIYVASGTDITPIQESARFLEVEKYFTQIMGAGFSSNPEQCAKEMVITQLQQTHPLKEGQLLCFGDGVPEIEQTIRAGGIAIGVLTPENSSFESAGHFTLDQKRERLIRAGAHILIEDFSNPNELMATLFSNEK